MLSWAQLYPNLNDLVGKVEQVTERKYGKEINFILLKKGTYWINIFSGWEYIYDYDLEGRVKKRTVKYNGKLQAEYTYQYETDENKQVSREIVSYDRDEKEGNYLELESFFDSKSRVEKVNYSAFDAKECTKETFLIEHSPVYENRKLISFFRTQINQTGDTTGIEKCIIEYNDLQKPVQITRIDLNSELSIKIFYTYNPENYLSQYSIDFLTEIQEYKKTQIQEIFFEYDKHGNWIKMFKLKDGKNIPEVRRKILYYD